jgi:hypothetical protein
LAILGKRYIVEGEGSKIIGKAEEREGIEAEIIIKAGKGIYALT